MQNNPTYRMYENDVDQLFGSRLEHYKMPGAGGDWDDLQQKLDARDNQRKKPAYGKWLLALLLLSGSIAGVIAVTSSSKKSAATEQFAQQEQAATVPGNVSNATKNNTNTNNDNGPVNQTPQNSNTNSPAAVNNNINTDNHTNNSTSSNTITTGAPVSNGNMKAGAIRTTPSIKPHSSTSFNDDKGTSIVPVNNKGRNPVTGKRASKSPVSNNRTTPATGDAANNVANNQRTGEAKPAQPEEAVTAPPVEDPEAVVIDEPTQPKAEEVKPVETVKAEDKNTGSIVKSNSNTDQNFANNTPKTKTKKTRTRKEAPEHEYISGMQGKWYIEAFSGYNNSIKHNKSFAAFLAPAGYVEKRLNQENALISLQAGVNVKYRRNHFIFGTGLSYLELGDMVKYDASYSGAVALNANGRSRLTYVEIPLSAGYDWANKRWGFSLQGGISAGILLGAKGQYVSLNSFNNDLFDLNSNKSTFRKTQLNLLVTPSVNYFMNENTNVFVSPLYRLNLQPVTATGAAINQKYYGMGLRVGIRTTLR